MNERDNFFKYIFIYLFRKKNVIFQLKRKLKNSKTKNRKLLSIKKWNKKNFPCKTKRGRKMYRQCYNVDGITVKLVWIFMDSVEFTLH